jgi:PLP dependent protein
MAQLDLIGDRYSNILGRIKSATRVEGRPDLPVLIAVSKTQPVEAIEKLYHLGHRDFGENYAQELLEKAEALHRRGCSEIRWHFIGQLQTNKVKHLLPVIHSIHTVDSERLGNELAKRWGALSRAEKLPVFVEVNVDQEKTKSGVLVSEVQEFVSDLSRYSELNIQGLMCIPSPDQNAQPKFRLLKELELQCRPMTQGKLSMGMSGDFEIAIQEGATHVRVGTAIFGEREMMKK